MGQPHKMIKINLNDLSNIKGEYGTIDGSNPKSLFLQLNGWISLSLPEDITNEEYLYKFETKVRKFINARATYIHNLSMYGFTSIEISEALINNNSKEAYFSIELTVLFKCPIEDFKENKELKDGIYKLIGEIEDKLKEFPEMTFNKYSSRKLKTINA